jgi:hypothetical protein
MIDIKKIFNGLISANEQETVRPRRIDISPSSSGLYIDTDGTPVTPYHDTIEGKDFKWVRESYSVIVPGLMEWYERYLQFVSNHSADFDWKGWHRDGLLFTRQIYLSLPRNIPMRYVVPSEDNSNTLESFDVTEEKLESLLAVLGDNSIEREPVISDLLVTGVKKEEGYIVIRIKIKNKEDSYIFQMEYATLKMLRLFLEKIALIENETISWESQHSECGMYFYSQKIGGLKHMGQLHIFSEREFAFSAYLNSRHLVRSIYCSLISFLGSLNDDIAYNLFQSNVLECYIDDKRYSHIRFFRSNPALANFIEPAIENVREFFREIYDSFFDEKEYL